MPKGNRLTGKVALITGAAGGIGSATARLFADEGAHLLLGDVDDTALHSLVDEIGDDRAQSAHLDVRSKADWTAAVTACESAFAAPTVLVNNAGVMRVGSIETATEEQFRETFDVNVIGSLLGIQATLDGMRTAGGGSIVIMSSAAAMEGTPGLPAYAASKAANRSLTQTAALELGRSGIRVNCITPGGIDTPMSNAPEFDGMDKDGYYAGLALGRIGRDTEIAAMVLHLASDESSYTTGATFVVDGGMLAGRYAL
jgi:3alpha(or 20beta)-hydroxysteroid dehydrogenase